MIMEWHGEAFEKSSAESNVRVVVAIDDAWSPLVHLYFPRVFLELFTG